MSVQEFSSALKSAALKAWFQRLSTDNILKMSAKDIRKKESGKEFNSFYITTKTVSDIIEKLSGAQATPEQVTKVFAKLASTKYGKSNTAKKIAEPYVEGEALYYPRVSMDSISTILDTGFEEVLSDVRSKNPDIKISDYFQKGHVFGIFPKKLAQTRKSIASNTTLTEEARSLVVGFLEDLEKQLEAEDLATSNLKTPGYKLYAKYKKRPNNYLVELQLVEDNETAGRAQSALAKAVRKYLNPGAIKFNNSGGIKFTEGDAEQRIRQLMEDNVEKLIGTKGSPSMLQLIQATIVDTLKGKKPSKKEYVSPNVEIIKSKPAKVNTTAIKAQIKKDLEQVRKLKQSVKAVPKIKQATPKTFNLTNLQLLINQQLQDVISANMGDGSAKNVLNYRTGRFASSVKVENLTESRNGMITAFYSYMKNPYATFSEGGRQQKPKSRDPKLLISASIREIAAEYVTNRLRAVVV